MYYGSLEGQAVDKNLLSGLVFFHYAGSFWGFWFR